MTEPELDFGYGVTGFWTSRGEREHAGIIEYHECKSGKCRHKDGTPAPCGGAVLFDFPDIREAFPDREVWTLVQEDPLTLFPSLQCHCCPHHGWIREGRWVPA